MSKKRPKPGSPEADDNTLYIAEEFYPSGAIRFRYAYRPAPDGTRVKHGWFVHYHEDGTVGSEGEYRDGYEEGPWKDYHENGRLAAKGKYARGKEHGRWRFWDRDGHEETPVEYDHGEEIG
jgi:antitoxin component YwqK of YwqJK toxin-antitoxin module